MHSRLLLLAPLALGSLSACSTTRHVSSLERANEWARIRPNVTVAFADGRRLAVRNLNLLPDTSWAFVPSEGTVQRWPTRTIISFAEVNRVTPLLGGTLMGVVGGSIAGFFLTPRRSEPSGVIVPNLGPLFDAMLGGLGGGLVGGAVGAVRGRTITTSWRPAARRLPPPSPQDTTRLAQ